MAQDAVVIPDKIYFKIGEVCELVGVQAHVLRYWETEFSVLSPQKNQSGQRSYRRKDVEIALRIKQLLYNEMFTIAGARKKIQTEIREGSKAKSAQAAQPRQPAPKPPAPPRPAAGIAERPGAAFGPTGAPLLFDAGFVSDAAHEPEADDSAEPGDDRPLSSKQIDTLRLIRSQLTEIRSMLASR